MDGGKQGRRRGLMLVLSSPSGAGKSTLSRMLLQQDENIDLSVSATTRPPRPGEIEGKHYRFVDQVRFKQMIQNDELLEWANVFGNSYGTPRAPVEQALSRGRDVLFDIDWQGTQQLKKNLDELFVSIFVLPPSVEELQQRLKTRAQDSHEVIKERMAKASGELSHWNEYEYVLTNVDLSQSFKNLQAVLTVERNKRDPALWAADQDTIREAEGLKRENQPLLSKFVQSLQSELVNLS